MASQQGTWRSEALGKGETLSLPQGAIRYHSTGSGPAIVFVHGALVNANLWRKVVAELVPDFRCVALDLPLGGHVLPMPPDADLSPPGLANLIADAIEALELEDVTLVGNDTGGALCQLVVTRRPERIGSLVLTSCDAFDNFPPKAMQPAMPLLRAPGALAAVLAPLRLKALRARMMTLMRAERHVERDAARVGRELLHDVPPEVRVHERAVDEHDHRPRAVLVVPDRPLRELQLLLLAELLRAPVGPVRCHPAHPA